MTRLILIAGIIFGLTGLSIGKSVKPDKAGKISDINQGKIDKIKDQAKSNDWAGIKQTYAEINWQDGDAVESLKVVAKEVPNNKNTKELRREIKTKYELLREDDIDLPGLADVKAYLIKIVHVPTIRLPLLVVDLLVVDFMAIDSLAVDSLIVVPLSIDFIICKDKEYEQAMDTWSRRWNVALDAVGTDGFRIIPNPRTALGLRRAGLMRQIEAQGWTAKTEAMWSQYYRDLASALNRRKALKKRR